MLGANFIMREVPKMRFGPWPNFNSFLPDMDITPNNIGCTTKRMSCIKLKYSNRFKAKTNQTVPKGPGLSQRLLQLQR